MRCQNKPSPETFKEPARSLHTQNNRDLTPFKPQLNLTTWVNPSSTLPLPSLARGETPWHCW